MDLLYYAVERASILSVCAYNILKIKYNVIMYGFISKERCKGVNKWHQE